MRILHIIPDIGVSNGIMSVILNYAKVMPDDITFDVVYLLDNPVDRKNDIESFGGRVFKLGNSPADVIKLKFFGFFKAHRGEWDAVHIHVPYFSAFIVPAARMAGIKKICCHCHSTLFSLNPKNVRKNQILNFPTRYIVKKKFACGDAAGKYWYGRNYTVIKNSIDCEKYRFNAEARRRFRDENGFENKLVIGHIGRTDIVQKNHVFLFEIFKEIKKINPDSVLLLIGGIKTDALFMLCEKLGIADSVLFLGPRDDVAQLMQAVDLFLFPSSSEGLPMSVIEAQTAGLPVLMSDVITSEVVVTDDVALFSLDELPKQWALKALEMSKNERKDNCEIMKAAGWDIFDSAKLLIDYYRG